MTFIEVLRRLIWEIIIFWYLCNISYSHTLVYAVKLKLLRVINPRVLFPCQLIYQYCPLRFKIKTTLHNSEHYVDTLKSYGWNHAVIFSFKFDSVDDEAKFSSDVKWSEKINNINIRELTTSIVAQMPKSKSNNSRLITSEPQSHPSLETQRLRRTSISSVARNSTT